MWKGLLDVLLLKFYTSLNLWALNILEIELIGNGCFPSLTLGDTEEASQSS